ncbi:jg23259 [Pararge aegeria aegeria]|uniref:Jg23259 protein n=1 Tax=Pararge aegeria aegeria TaxID=348720 RepID=A0A8S4QH95_9NEOP|nr:jg23259 [Pararge aegeria aegeria]
MRTSVEEPELSDIAERVKLKMGGAHCLENRWTLGFQGAGMATPHRKTQRWLARNEVNSRHQSRWEPLETNGPGSWILELPTKYLCDDDDDEI